MLVTIVSGAGEVLQSRFLLVKVVKGLIPLHSGRKESNYGCLISRTDYFCAVYLSSKFSSYFLLHSLKAMHAIVVFVDFVLIVYQGTFGKKKKSTSTTTSKQQNKTNLNKKMAL